MGSTLLWSQGTDSTSLAIPRDIEVNFLMSYYDQSGNHSAVNGGIGTESLNDYSSVVIVNVPLDSSKTLTIKTGVTYYTSASNDNIDFRISSASKKEIRGDLDLLLSNHIASKGITHTYNFGASIDVDYLSTSIGYRWSKIWPKRDKQLSLEGKFYYDSWVWLVYPIEIRGTDRATVPSRKRLTYSATASYYWTINKRLQASVIVDPTYQHGLLSTPFHRVFFADSSGTFLENLPLDRFKLPVALRLHYFVGDLLTARFYYRYYWDSFGINGHTFNLEVPIKFTPSFTLFPYYRFHTQSGADYFKPFKKHLISEVHFTSDYDLSELYSHRYGIGIRIAPISGISTIKWSKRKYLDFKSLELRFSNYRREDGLKATAISANSSLTIH